MLQDITLDRVLAGDTCEPISLKDFEAYLEYKEHSLENLHFIVWYQDYRRRFFLLPDHVQALSPGPREFAFALPTPARTAARLARPTSPPVSSSPLSTTFLLSQDHPNPDSQPFRCEISSIIATFLVPSSPRAINLDCDLLQHTLASLTHNTHPDVLLPIYEVAYDALYSFSLPTFLRIHQNNIGIGKTIYWWLYGLLTFFIGFAIVFICLFVESRAQGGGVKRSWRLWSVPFLCIGSMQMYSAYRGFCSEVWGRNSTQLKPWELEIELEQLEEKTALQTNPQQQQSTPPLRSLDVKKSPPLSPPSEYRETKVEFATGREILPCDSSESVNIEAIELVEYPPFHVHNIASSSRPASTSQSPLEASFKKDAPAPWLDLDLSALALNAYTGPESVAVRPTSGQAAQVYRDCWDHPPSNSSHGRKGSQSHHHLRIHQLPTHTKVFGPERLVLDPRIRAAHRRVVRDILIAGCVCGVVLTTVVVALPNRR